MTRSKMMQWNAVECEGKHRWLNWSSGIILTFLGLLVTVTGWALWAANNASGKAQDANAMAVATSIKVDDNWQSSLRQLAGLREALKEIQASQVKGDDRIIEELRANRALVEKLIMERHNQSAGSKP